METFLEKFNEKPLINLTLIGIIVTIFIGLIFFISIIAPPLVGNNGGVIAPPLAGNNGDVDNAYLNTLHWFYDLAYFFGFVIIVTEILFLVESWQRRKDKVKITFGGTCERKIACLFTAIIYYPYFAVARFVLSKFGISSLQPMELLTFVGVVGAFFIWVGINYLINKGIKEKKAK